jgi:hypothetical protein
MCENRRKVIAVIGSGRSVEEDIEYNIAMDIGRLLVDNGFRVLTGGLGGVMEAALKGARNSAKYREGDTIAIIPTMNASDSNQFADIVIPTGIGIGRNIIVTNSDGVIAIGGGSGTLSEIAFAWQKRRPIVALEVPGWSGELAGRSIDDKGSEIPIQGVEGAEQAVSAIKGLLLDNNINR